jgi:hypothetical protein
MQEPFFVVLCIEIPHPPAKSRCSKCKREFFTGNWFVVVKIRKDDKNAWYLAAEEAACCDRKGKTIWVANDEHDAVKKGKEILRLLQLANKGESENIFTALVQAPQEFATLISNSDRARSHELN